MLSTLNQKSFSIFQRIITFISSIFIKEENPIFTLSIPNSILHRTELICSYISEQYETEFEIENFLMLLYLDFIKNSIKSYNPQTIFKSLSKNYYEDDIINLSSGTNNYRVVRKHYEKTSITLQMGKNDVDQGELILDELYDLYKYRIPFSKLLENLWIGFIEDYKTGTNKRAYYTIAKLLKNCFE